MKRRTSETSKRQRGSSGTSPDRRKFSRAQASTPDEQIDAGHSGGPRPRRRHRQRARCSEGVEHPPPLDEAADAAPVLAHVAEQADVQRAQQVHLVRRAQLVDHQLRGGVSPTTSSLRLRSCGSLPRTFITTPRKLSAGSPVVASVASARRRANGKRPLAGRAHHRVGAVDVDPQPGQGIPFAVDEPVGRAPSTRPKERLSARLASSRARKNPASNARTAWRAKMCTTPFSGSATPRPPSRPWDRAAATGVPAPARRRRRARSDPAPARRLPADPARSARGRCL